MTDAPSGESKARPSRRSRILKECLLVLLVLLPFGIRSVYRLSTALPKTIRIAGGPPGGRYQQIGLALAAAIQQKHGIKVEVISTEGSLENLRRLEDGEVEFAMYQSEAADGRVGPASASSDQRQPAFVANVYSEAIHLLVRADLDVRELTELGGKRLAIGTPRSGDFASAKVLLDFFRLGEAGGIELELVQLGYPQIRQGFVEGSLDAAIVTAGLGTPLIQELAASGHCRLMALPLHEAVASLRAALTAFTIPAGTYRTVPDPIPPIPLATVAARAQLLTRSDARTEMVEAITAALLDEQFLRSQRLIELFESGAEFARRKPEFPVHPGAEHFYSPDLKPLLNADFVEALEGMRSFIVSLLIAGFLLLRWMGERRVRQQEHRLDRFIRRLLEIERRQLDLDEIPDRDDSLALQRLLDEVTRLRQDALRELSAHDMSDDKAAESFIRMCHALSDKLNAKLLRQRIDLRFRELRSALESRLPPAP